ncbi:MAG: hypothetical protein JSW08_03665 [archaeon]|nr:MAG: hypothetical protein JSW08_03665 [archaeon]
MPFKDVEKRREYRRKWYSKNRESEIAHVKRRRKEIRKWCMDHKSELKCSKCGEDHPATLEFHHKKGKKDKSIAYMSYFGYSIKRIKKEMDKCVVLCSNCHKKEHHKNR